jgi:hypothetical protein
MKSSLLLLRKFFLYISCIIILSIHTIGVRDVGAGCKQPFSYDGQSHSSLHLRIVSLSSCLDSGQR